MESRVIVRAAHALNVCYARAYHRLQVVSPCRLPRDGPAILVCNHISGLDPAMLQAVSFRIITWMVAREFYEAPGLRWFFKELRAIPVDRGGRDFSATREALRALGAGRILGVFPEGRIEKQRELLPFQTGVAMMAMKTGVTIYPAAIEGSQRGIPMLQAYLRPQSAAVAFGEQINLSGDATLKSDLPKATLIIQSAVERLRQGLEAALLERRGM